MLKRHPSIIRHWDDSEEVAILHGAGKDSADGGHKKSDEIKQSIYIPKRPEVLLQGKEGDNTTIEDISLLERALSLLSAMVSGLFYGTMWLPVNYMMVHPEIFPGTPKEPLPYIFSFCCGVLSTTVVVFLIYAIARRNHPWVSAETAIPAFLTGVVYACGMTSFVVAIDQLDAAIAYPICQMAPGLVISSWSVLYYREISGRRNLLFLAAAYLLTVVGVALVTISGELHVF
ncbi:hypothetical protein Y032_0011g1241 [Ancylostoma ceylanicum]|uniref:Uncharacterized protein n=1 Tax=Ancylostoma ceylanicum TaxID=53326 RepID=A0A016VE21_9BILA|nr:hypothetical protein Y032_0011g1241 [Ancylostoma ceylanicum]